MPRPKPHELERARRLPTGDGAFEPRPDPVEARSRALTLLRGSSAAYAGVLVALALGAPGWTGGDPRAALLPGVPGILAAILFALGGKPARRRVAMALVTSIAGFLALATAGSVAALGEGGAGRPAVLFQLACFAASCALLAVAGPAWRRVNSRGEEADSLLRMYEEL
jgi:hypothetical protein